jgi:hypothetical protein
MLCRIIVCGRHHGCVCARKRIGGGGGSSFYLPLVGMGAGQSMQDMSTDESLLREQCSSSFAGDSVLFTPKRRARSIGKEGLVMIVTLLQVSGPEKEFYRTLGRQDSITHRRILLKIRTTDFCKTSLTCLHINPWSREELGIRVCSVREQSGMECNGSIPLEWVGSILVFS